MTAWLAGIIAAIIGIAGAFLAGMHKGKTGAQQEQRAAQADHAAQVAKSVQEVKREVTKLPDAPAQRVDDADPGTAAGKLHDWMRKNGDSDA